MQYIVWISIIWIYITKNLTKNNCNNLQKELQLVILHLICILNCDCSSISNSVYACKLHKWLSSDLMNHSLHRLFKITDSFQSKTSYCVYEWVTESFTPMIHSKMLIRWWIYKWLSLRVSHWAIHSKLKKKKKKWLSLWVSQWIIYSMIRSKVLIHSGSFKSGYLYEWVNSTSLFKNTIQEQNKWLSLWAKWIILSTDSFETT